MPQIVLDRSECPCCHSKMVFRKTVTGFVSQYDSYECPKCKIMYALNWHPLGEPDRPSAAHAA